MCGDVTNAFDYNTVFHQMTDEEVTMANFALDKQMAAIKKQMSKK